MINGKVKAWGPSAAEVFDCNESGAGRASSGAVRPRQVLVRLHFRQPAARPVELETESLADIQFVDGGVRSQDQLHAAVVELVDQRYEPARRIVQGLVHLRHLADQYGVEVTRDFDEVGL